MCECPMMYDENIVKARKPHWCCECGTTIVKGEIYQSISGIWDGSFNRFHTCMSCVETRQKATEGLNGGDCCDLPALGDLRQYLVDGDMVELYAPIHERWKLARQLQEQRSPESPK